jgi:hypothetical protein
MLVLLVRSCSVLWARELVWLTRLRGRMLRDCQFKLVGEHLGSYFLRSGHSESSMFGCRKRRTGSAAWLGTWMCSSLSTFALLAYRLSHRLESMRR